MTTPPISFASRAARTPDVACDANETPCKNSIVLAPELAPQERWDDQVSLGNLAQMISHAGRFDLDRGRRRAELSSSRPSRDVPDSSAWQGHSRPTSERSAGSGPARRGSKPTERPKIGRIVAPNRAGRAPPLPIRGLQLALQPLCKRVLARRSLH